MAIIGTLHRLLLALQLVANSYDQSAHAEGFQIRIRYSAHTIDLCSDQARLDIRKATARFKQAARWCTARTVEMQRVRW